MGKRVGRLCPAFPHVFVYSAFSVCPVRNHKLKIENADELTSCTNRHSPTHINQKLALRPLRTLCEIKIDVKPQQAAALQHRTDDGHYQHTADDSVFPIGAGAGVFGEGVLEHAGHHIKNHQQQCSTQQKRRRPIIERP